MELIKALLQRDPERRPSMKQARDQFDWLKPDKEEVQSQYFWNRCYSSVQEESKKMEMPMNFTPT